MRDPITRIHSTAIYVQLLLNGFGFSFGFGTSVAGRANAFVTTISRTVYGEIPWKIKSLRPT